MTLSRLSFLRAASLGAAALLAASAAGAAGTPHAAPLPDEPRLRVGNYKIVKRGPRVIHARCLEGGNVIVPTHEKATAAQRDRDIHDACKSLDYTK